MCRVSSVSQSYEVTQIQAEPELKDVEHKGKFYQIGALYEFSNRKDFSLVHIGSLKEIVNTNHAFVSDIRYRYCRELQEAPKIGTIRTTYEVGGIYKATTGDGNTEYFIYNDCSQSESIANDYRYVVSELSNIVKMVPEKK